MLDIKFVRENPEAVKENIKKKFQDDKLPLVDEVINIFRLNSRFSIIHYITSFHPTITLHF